MEHEKKLKPNGLRLKSTKKLKTMTLRECGKHVLMELCKNTGRAWIKKSNGSTDHTQNCPMCGITYEERVKRGGGAHIEGSHVGVDFQPMLNHAFKQVFMTHQCDELTNSEILQKVMSIFHDLHNLAVKNRNCAIQPSCKSCNWYLGKCTVQQVDCLKNNPQAWGKHVLAFQSLKNTCSQPTITSMLQSQDSSDEESSDSNSDTGDLGRRENKQEKESSDEESSLKRPRGSVDTDSCESRPSTSESKRQRRVNTRPDYRNNGANLANAKRETHESMYCQTTDEWAEWVDGSFQKTNNKEDTISKNELLSEARCLKSNPDLNWKVVKLEFKRRGYFYDSQKVEQTMHVKTKGFVTCIKRVSTEVSRQSCQ